MSSNAFDRIKESMGEGEFQKGKDFADAWVEKVANFEEFKRIGEGNYSSTLKVPKIDFLEGKPPEFKQGFAAKVKELWMKFRKQEKI